MKVVIFGYGGVGSVLAKMLSKEKTISQVICGDILIKKDKIIGKIHLKKIDLNNREKVIKFLKEINPEVVVNSAIPNFNLRIMDICLQTKVNYLDLASYWDLDKNPKALVPYEMEQMRYAKKFTDNHIKGLIESGVAPGLTNLLSAECASKLDSVDYLKIRMCEDTGSKEIFFSWNKEWLLDEIACKPIIYENGKFPLVECFGGEEEYEFPKPIGKKKTYYFAQDEVGSIPFYVKTKKLDVKIYDNNIEVSKLLLALGLVSNKEVEVDGVKVKPIKLLSKILPDTKPGDEKRFPNSMFAVAIEAIGKKSGKNKSIKYSVIFPNQKTIEKMNLGANFISYPTALCAKLFAMAIPKIKNIGVFPPEALNKSIREEILAQLNKEKSLIIKKNY